LHHITKAYVFITSAIFLVHLVTRVTSQCHLRTDKFRRYSVPENMPVSPHMTGESIFAQTAAICLIKCVEKQICQGMIFDDKTKRCFLKECVNPHQFTEYQGSDSDYHIQISQRANVEPNKHLARGRNGYIIIAIDLALQLYKLGCFCILCHSFSFAIFPTFFENILLHW